MLSNEVYIVSCKMNMKKDDNLMFPSWGIFRYFNLICKIVKMGAMKIIRLNKKPILLCSIITSFILFILYHRMYSPIDDLDRKARLALIDEFIKSHGSGGSCKIPNLPVDAPEMMKFVKDEPSIDCSAAEPDWVTVNGSTCTITEQARNKYGTISCKFIDLIRVNDNQVRDGTATQVVNTSYTLRASDVVKVQCKAKSKEWSMILTGIRNDKNLMNRVGWFPKLLPPDALNLNVLIFGFDSLSRNTFIRKLPKSYKYLTEVLGAHVLEGYNIVGDGTPQALIPILTGRTELELPDTRKRVSGSAYVDVYPFLWNDFRRIGYATGYLEDMANVGTFTYRLNGFKDPPTDHYMRPYYIAAMPYWSRSPRLCYGSTPRHMLMLNHVKNFFQVYKDKPKFMFGFHGELSHDSYNNVGLVDDDLLKFLSDLNEGGYLKDTLLVTMSDHGHRFADIRNTLQGKQEERLPFFSFTFPEKFKTEHPEEYQNFINNKQRLTTPFDIYPTLKSVLSLKSYSPPANLRDRSISLFSQIPKERNCANAYIEPHWCSCLDWIEVPKDYPIVQRLAETLVNNINSYTEEDRKTCEILKLKEILWVAQLSPNDNLLRFRKNADIDGFIADLSADMKIDSNLYQLKVELTPGDSLFEASITHYLKEGKFSMSKMDVSRINKYGNQARCLSDQQLEIRKYCYCKDGL